MGSRWSPIETTIKILKWGLQHRWLKELVSSMIPWAATTEPMDKRPYTCERHLKGRRLSRCFDKTRHQSTNMLHYSSSWTTRNSSPDSVPKSWLTCNPCQPKTHMSDWTAKTLWWSKTNKPKPQDDTTPSITGTSGGFWTSWVTTLLHLQS